MMEMPAKNSKMMRSTQLVYMDEKSQHFHKLDNDIVTQSPILSKRKKRESRLSRMSQLGGPRFTKKDTEIGDENGGQENLPIIQKSRKSKKERKSKEEKKQVKPSDLVVREEKEEDKEKKQVGREKSMNWADMEEIPPLRQTATCPEPRRRHARMRSLQPSHPDISSKFKFFYTSSECKSCEQMLQFCQQVPPPVESRSAETNPLKLNEALTFARKHKEILVIQKGSVEKIQLNTQFDPPTPVLEKKILGKDGRMKTPCAVVGYTLVVGFNEEIMRESLFFGNKSPTSFKRKRRGSISRPLSTMKRSKKD